MVRSLRNQVVVASLLSLSSIGAFHSPAAEVNSLLPQLGANHAQTNETTLSAANHGGLDGQLTIRVYDYARLPKGEYEPARGQAEHILSQAGVPTRRLRCALAPAEAKDPGCEEVITPTDLVVRILPVDMAVRVPVKGNVFGYAVPSRDNGFGTVVSVFHHRVAELIAQKHRRAGGRLYSKAVVLGHILAHELGHVLLGPNSHSRSGIMAFPWGPKQLAGSLRGELLFSKAESATILREVRERQQARQIRASARERIDEATSHRIVDAPPALTVNIYNHAQAPQSTLSVATAETARILRDTGIETRWAQCATEPELIPQFPDCSMPGPASLVMRIIPRSMARPKPPARRCSGWPWSPKTVRSAGSPASTSRPWPPLRETTKPSAPASSAT
jgi:hypothetical protein